jgi:hypothetical protein
MKNKKLNLNKRSFLFIWGIILVICVLLIIIETIITINVEKQQKETADYSAWLSQNCICLESNLLSCPAGFKLVGKLCLDKENSADSLKSCSKYDCLGEIKFFNVNTQKWQNQN